MRSLVWLTEAGNVKPQHWQVIEQAVAEGANAFTSFNAEPQRLAWWGRLQAADDDFFVKCRMTRSTPEKIVSTIFERGLRKEWRQSLWLRQQGLPCVDLIGLAEQRTCRMLQSSLIVTRWHPDSRCLLDVCKELSGAARLELLVDAGRLFGQLLSIGAIHKQFHPRNVLITTEADGARRLIPIDLQHLLISGNLSKADHLWALDQLSYWLHDHWLHEPMMDWSANSADSAAFYDGVFATCGTLGGNTTKIREQVEQRRQSGRAGRIKRWQWTED